jgi:hypothetical protein
MKKNIFILIIVTGLVFALCDHTLLAGKNVIENSNISRILNELRQGSLTGEVGIYNEHINYDKENYIEDDEIMELNDSDLIAPYFQINYTTPVYAGFSLGAGLTGFTHINGNSDRENSIDDYDKFVVHQIYLKYDISQTAFKIGRQKHEESFFLSDYYESFRLTSQEIQNLFLSFSLVKKVADSDISKFLEFQNVNRGDNSIDDYLYATEITWTIVPNAITITPYYYHQGNLYDLYGSHVELFHETEEITIGLNMDAYATDENNDNGMRDINDEVKNSGIYHINPYVEISNFTLAAGYIEADRDVGAREGGLIDDYFNPFNEGDNVYEADARTWYGSLSYEADSFNAGLVFGRTEYIDDEQHLTEEEFNINASLKFLENFKLETEFAIVNSESPQGDFKLLEMALTYEF